jgi:hypothetical protein
VRNRVEQTKSPTSLMHAAETLAEARTVTCASSAVEVKF